MNDLDRLSYSLGLNIARNLQNQGIEKVNPNLLAEAIASVISGETLRINDQEANAFLNQYMSALQAKKHEATILEGKTFLESNGKKKNVITLASGLQYEVLKEGSGIKPTIHSTVTTHYHGTKIDGSVFDSSVERGSPASFPVNGVIAGWTEALQLMALGSKWRLFVPAHLAYGERGAGPQIGPHTTLIFEVELLEIK